MGLISKFIIKGSAKDVVHSSGYGVAQNEGGIGVASTRSFAERMKVDRNRTKIKGYRDARVVSEQGRDAWRIRQEVRQMGESAKDISVGGVTIRRREEENGVRDRRAEIGVGDKKAELSARDEIKRKPRVGDNIQAKPTHPERIQPDFMRKK